MTKPLQAFSDRGTNRHRRSDVPPLLIGGYGQNPDPHFCTARAVPIREGEHGEPPPADASAGEQSFPPPSTPDRTCITAGARSEARMGTTGSRRSPEKVVHTPHTLFRCFRRMPSSTAVHTAFTRFPGLLPPGHRRRRDRLTPDGGITPGSCHQQPPFLRLSRPRPPSGSLSGRRHPTHTWCA